MMQSAWEQLQSKLPNAIAKVCPSRFGLEGKHGGTDRCVVVTGKIFDREVCIECWMEPRKEARSDA
jgi:hypothetical protein